MTYPIVLQQRRSPLEELLLGLSGGIEAATGPIAGKIEQNKSTQQKIMQAILSGDIPQEYLRTKEFRAYLEKVGRGNPFIEEALKSTAPKPGITQGTQITGQAIPESPLAGMSLEPGGEKFASTKTGEEKTPVKRATIMNKILSLQEAEQQIKEKKINEALEMMIRQKKIELDFQREGILDPQNASRAAALVAAVQTKYPDANVSWDENGISIKGLSADQRKEIQSQIRASDALATQRTQDAKREAESAYFRETEPDRTRFTAEYQSVMDLLDTSKITGFSSSDAKDTRKAIAKVRLADLNKRIQQYNTMIEVSGRTEGIDPNVIESRKIPPYTVDPEKLLPSETDKEQKAWDIMREYLSGGGGHIGIPGIKEFPDDVKRNVEALATKYSSPEEFELAKIDDTGIDEWFTEHNILPEKLMEAFRFYKKNGNRWK